MRLFPASTNAVLPSSYFSYFLKLSQGSQTFPFPPDRILPGRVAGIPDEVPANPADFVSHAEHLRMPSIFSDVIPKRLRGRTEDLMG